MKYLGAMLFKEQAQDFVQLIIYQVPSRIFAHFRFMIFTQEKQTRMLIHVRIKLKDVFQMLLSMCFAIVENLKIADIRYLSEWHFWHNYHNHDKNPSYPSVLFTFASRTLESLASLRSLTFLVVSKQNNENMEYLDTFIPFRSCLYSRPGSPIFLLFGS